MRRSTDKIQWYTVYALMALILIQGLVNSFLYASTLWSLYKFDALVGAIAERAGSSSFH